MSTSFGEFFAKVRRDNVQVSLREFCQKHGFDPGNVSKLERGRVAVPESPEVLERYARALGLLASSKEWVQFFDLAAAERGRIPAELMDDAEVVAKLPILFRSLRGERVSESELSGLIEMIRRT